MAIPVEFETAYRNVVRAGKSDFQDLEDALVAALESKFRQGEFVTVKGRVKNLDSTYAKCLLGKYQSIEDIRDLFGLTVVMLRRSALDDAIEFLASEGASEKQQGFSVRMEDNFDLTPSDFRFSERKGYITQSPTILEAGEVPLTAEIQFTTVTQHSLDLATHDFDYKGSQIAWERFRAVSRLRAIAEQLDLAIDQIVNRQSIGVSDDRESREFRTKREELDTLLRGKPSDVEMPKNVIRLVETVERWLKAFGLESRHLMGFEWPRDLMANESISTEEKIFTGIFQLAAQEHGVHLTSKIDPDFRFVIGSELWEERDLFGFERIPDSNRFSFRTESA